MTIAVLVLKVLLLVAAAASIFVLATNWPSRLDLRVAMRYLRSRRSSRLLSLITVIAVGGVTIGVMALVIVLGVMNGMQNDLREKILVVNPHLRVLTYGEGLRLDDWAEVLRKVRGTDGVVAAAPFVLSQGLISAGHDYAEAIRRLESVLQASPEFPEAARKLDCARKAEEYGKTGDRERKRRLRRELKACSG